MEGNSFSVVGLVLNHPTWEEVDAERKGRKTYRETLGVCSECFFIDGGNRGLRHMFSDALAGR